MSNRIDFITDQFQPISLADINKRASLQTRADNKYFVPWQEFVDFAAALTPDHAVMEIDGKRAFSYDTQYFDTPELTSYWGHVQGRRKRFKCRTRVYMDTDLCVFELKLKSGRGETVKYKINYNQHESRMVNDVAAAFLDDRLIKAYGVGLTSALVPTLHNSYQRVTLAGLNSAERITCDFNLNFGDGERWHGQMSEDYVLVETKSARGRGYADQLLWKLGVRPSGGSKYCVGMSILRPDLRNNPFKLARRHFSSSNEAAEVDRPATERVAALPPTTAASPLTAMPSPALAMLE